MYNLNRYARPDYEYLSRWPCDCGGRASCNRCEGTGHVEEWLRLDDIFKFGPVTIMGYRLAGIWDLKFGNATSDLAAQYFGPYLRVSIAVDSHPPARKAGPILLGYRDETGHSRP